MNTWLRRTRAAALVLGCSTVLLAACAEQQQEEAAVAPATAPLPGKGNFHVVVERGQTLDRIAQLYHVAKHDVIAANQLKPPYTLKPGTILAIPLSAVQSTGQSATKATAPASANRDRAVSAVRRNVNRPVEEIIELDDVPTHSLPMPKPELPGIRSN